MQIDAPINRGNSGGPTFDIDGRVVGVNTAIFSPSGGSVGIGFAIPADVADNITKALISGGKVTRGFLGVTIQNVTPEIAESLGIGAKQGALVNDVVSGGPADKGGVMAGDVVLSVNGKGVTSASDLTRQVRPGPAPARPIKLEVLRGGKHVTNHRRGFGRASLRGPAGDQRQRRRRRPSPTEPPQAPGRPHHCARHGAGPARRRRAAAVAQRASRPRVTGVAIDQVRADLDRRQGGPAAWRRDRAGGRPSR